MQIQSSLDFSLGYVVDYNQLPDSITYVRDIWTSDLTDKILSQEEVTVGIETYGSIATIQFGFRDGTVIIADARTIKNIGDVKEMVNRVLLKQLERR
jgi:hypothetical protein